MSHHLSAVTGIAVLLASAALTSLAQAHVILETREAPAHSFFRAPFLVGHGCDGSATTSIRVTIPEGVVGVKPMPKPGWTLSIEEGAYARPAIVHGKSVDRGVTAVTWRGGPLPDAWTDEFLLTAQLPDRPAGTILYFPVVQECEAGVRHWDEIPGAAGATAPLKAPAPALTLGPARAP